MEIGEIIEVVTSNYQRGQRERIKIRGKSLGRTKGLGCLERGYHKTKYNIKIQ